LPANFNFSPLNFKFSPHHPLFSPHHPVFSPLRYVRSRPTISCELGGCSHFAPCTTQIKTSGDGLGQPNRIGWRKTGAWHAPMERTQLSREQSKCLFCPRAGIRVSGAGTPNTKTIISCTQSVEALHFGHVYFKTQSSMASSEDPCEAEEHDLQKQPKKKKRINEPRDWIEVNRWNWSDHSDKKVKVFICAELDELIWSA
jgi:hypothetical protein